MLLLLLLGFQSCGVVIFWLDDGDDDDDDSEIDDDNCCSICVTSTMVMIPSNTNWDDSASSNQKIEAIGPGLANPEHSMRMASIGGGFVVVVSRLCWTVSRSNNRSKVKTKESLTVQQTHPLGKSMNSGGGLASFVSFGVVRMIPFRKIMDSMEVF